MISKLLLCLLTIFFSSSSAWAMRSVQADVGDDSYHVGFFGTYFGGEYGALALSPDIIVKSAGHTIFAPAAYWYFEPDNNPLFQEIALGARAYFAGFESQNTEMEVDALAFGMMARTRALSYSWPFHLMGGVHYAPDATTANDAQNLFAWNINLEYALLKQVFVYIGYRDIMVETLQNKEAHLDDTGYVGLRLTF